MRALEIAHPRQWGLGLGGWPEAPWGKWAVKCLFVCFWNSLFSALFVSLPHFRSANILSSFMDQLTKTVKSKQLKKKLGSFLTTKWERVGKWSKLEGHGELNLGSTLTEQEGQPPGSWVDWCHSPCRHQGGHSWGKPGKTALLVARTEPALVLYGIVALWSDGSREPDRVSLVSAPPYLPPLSFQTSLKYCL